VEEEPGWAELLGMWVSALAVAVVGGWALWRIVEVVAR
jgi:hypothetical protein